MKLLTTLTASLLLAASIATTASANDQKGPELLIGLSDTQVEKLSDNESAETRGERVKIRFKKCVWRACWTATGTVTVKVRRNGRTYYVNH